MKTVLQLMAVLIAIVLGSIGALWLVMPSVAAPHFGPPLPEGPGLSSLVADISSFVLTVSAALLVALISGRRLWYHVPINNYLS